jgi:uncharacterized protein (DUF433 family)
MDWREHISADPAVMVGKPVITGTRIPVDLLLEKIAFQSFDEILLDYPGLTRADLQAVVLYVLYVLDVLRMDDVVPALRPSP